MEGHCSKYINIQRRSGPESDFKLSPPVITAPSFKEEEVPKIPKGASGLNVEFLEDIGVFTPTSDSYSDNELYTYLALLLSKFLEREHIAAILNKDTISFWRTCFTHVSYDPNYDKNYESLESVGDKILSYTFKTFLYGKYDQITASQLNNLDQHYMSTHLQALVSSKMGLSNWLRVKGEVPKGSEKIKEDLLEAFFGTIDTLFIKKFGIGYGVKTCMKFIDKLFLDVDLNMNIEIPRTFVTQIFDRLGVDRGTHYDTVTEAKSDNTGWTTKIRIKETGLRVFENLDISLGNTALLFAESRPTKKPTEYAAFTKVMMFLISKGVTSAWVKEVKRNEMIETQIGKETYRQVIARAQKVDKDIVKVDVQETYKSKPAKAVVQIIGTTYSGIKIVLKSFSTYAEKSEAFDDIIDKFLKS
jgi:dsRNA-specific ribonuclease